MPKDMYSFFEALGNHFLESDSLQIPDPLLGENRCQERALYFSFIFWLALALFLELYVPCMLGVLFVLYNARQFSRAIKEFFYV